MHRAAESGSSRAFHCLGVNYIKGDGVEQDLDRALDYLQKSAEGGCIQAFAVVGAVLIQKGEMEEGCLNYRKAALCGLSDKDVFDVLRDGYKEGYYQGGVCLHPEGKSESE